MKQRLDIYLTENGLIATREKAKAVIMAGEVYVNEQKADKAGQMVSAEDKVEVRADSLRYVSRGGLKLEKAMEVFPISLENAVCMDIGASTGGFTDCMLQNGAKKVYAIDVGYGQLAWSLRTDARVVNLERTNIRYVTEKEISENPDFASIDVSFISLRLVLPVAFARLHSEGEVVCLIKPQFEAGKEKVGKKGVVREPETHMEVLDSFVALAKELEFTILGLTFSPVKGPEGNIEFLAHLTLDDIPGIEPDTASVVAQAHETLKGGSQ